MQQIGKFTQLLLGFVQIGDVLRENWPILLVWFFVVSLVAGALICAFISFALMWFASRFYIYVESRRARQLATENATENATRWHNQRAERTNRLKEWCQSECRSKDDWPWIDDEGNDLE